MMLEKTRRVCELRAGWYIARIDNLTRYMKERSPMDSDDVQLCQSMLRELLARFRLDRRPPESGVIVSESMRACLSAIDDAGSLLRVTAVSRPTSRWRDELALCRGRITVYLAGLPVG